MHHGTADGVFVRFQRFVFKDIQRIWLSGGRKQFRHALSGGREGMHIGKHKGFGKIFDDFGQCFENACADNKLFDRRTVDFAARAVLNLL